MAEESREPDRGTSVTAVAVETLATTAVALVLSLRFDAPVVWLALPLAWVVAGRGSPAEFGLDLRFRPPSWATHLALGGALLLLYAALHAWFAREVLGQAFVPRALPPLGSLGFDFVNELLAIGIPEEVFFRGYLQQRWNRCFGRPWTVFHAAVGPGLLIQSALFAVCHLASGDWTRLRVFFFALLAGWLRERSGSIAAPATYHAVANLWYRVVASSFR
jgi:membrane protease YdiL (CAAX protease family)